jgi:hypothetical protein
MRCAESCKQGQQRWRAAEGEYGAAALRRLRQEAGELDHIAKALFPKHQQSAPAHGRAIP